MMPPWWPGMILKGTPDDLLLVVVDTESASSNSASVAQSRTLSACALQDERSRSGRAMMQTALHKERTKPCACRPGRRRDS
jgi:hypothetical protein